MKNFKIKDRIINKKNNKIGVIKDILIINNKFFYYILYDDNTDEITNNNLIYLKCQSYKF